MKSISRSLDLLYSTTQAALCLTLFFLCEAQPAFGFKTDLPTLSLKASESLASCQVLIESLVSRLNDSRVISGDLFVATPLEINKLVEFSGLGRIDAGMVVRHLNKAADDAVKLGGIEAALGENLHKFLISPNLAIVADKINPTSDELVKGPHPTYDPHYDIARRWGHPFFLAQTRQKGLINLTEISKISQALELIYKEYDPDFRLYFMVHPQEGEKDPQSWALSLMTIASVDWLAELLSSWKQANIYLIKNGEKVNPFFDKFTDTVFTRLGREPIIRPAFTETLIFSELARNEALLFRNSSWETELNHHWSDMKKYMREDFVRGISELIYLKSLTQYHDLPKDELPFDMINQFYIEAKQTINRAESLQLKKLL